MKHVTTCVLVAVAFLAAMSSVGCNNKDKMIQGLTTRNQELQNEKQELQDQLAQSKAREDALAAEVSAKQAELDTVMAHQKDLESKQRRPGRRPAAGWERGIVGDKVTVGTDILFAAGKADLTSGGKSALDKIAADLKGTYSGMPVRVYGYTDSDPIRKSRRALAGQPGPVGQPRHGRDALPPRARASAPRTLRRSPWARTHPVADNSTAAGKAKNRRVEIVVIRK